MVLEVRRWVSGASHPPSSAPAFEPAYLCRDIGAGTGFEPGAKMAGLIDSFAAQEALHDGRSSGGRLFKLTL